MTTGVKGRFTFRFAAVCFALSALFELLNLQDQALLFGHIVGGIPAVFYHIVYAVLFAWLAMGLWNGTRSGYYALFVASIIYTVDRLQIVMVGDTLAMSLRQQVAQYPEVLQIITVDDLARMMTMTTLVLLICWWGFVGYAYYRRDYFGISRTPR